MHLEIGPLRVGKPRVGVALGSGSARGWSHIGVLKELEAAGIEIDIVTGTSAGGVIGSFFAADAIEHAEEFAAKKAKKPWIIELVTGVAVEAEAA